MPLVDLREAARAVAVTLPNRPVDLAAARATWRGRMVNEHGSSAVFMGIAAQMVEAGASPAAVAACRTFAEEERRHGVLCGAVLEALGGEARWEADPPEPVPPHADVAPREAVLRNVLAVCCLAETVAVSLIGAERLEMPAGPLRDLLSSILADEVGHARFGWRWLAAEAPSLDAAARDRLSAYLRVAFRHLEQDEHARLAVGRQAPAVADAALGVCDALAQRDLFRDTVVQVIVPRLEAQGLAAARAWEMRAA